MLAHWDDLRQEEEQLEQRELQVAAQERALTGDESKVASDAQALQADIEAESTRLTRLASQGVIGARDVLDALPRIVPPPGVLERMRAMHAREQCLTARAAAVEARKKAVSLLQGGMSQCRGTLVTMRARIAAMEVGARQTGPASSAEALPTHARPMAGGDERRVHPRIPVQCEVDFETESNFYSGFTHDMSQGGVFVATFDVAPIGAEIDLRVALPDGVALELRGVVRWQRNYNDLNPNMWPGMGVEFVNLPEQAKSAIAAFIAERAPWFYTE